MAHFPFQGPFVKMEKFLEHFSQLEIPESNISFLSTIQNVLRHLFLTHLTVLGNITTATPTHRVLGWFHSVVITIEIRGFQERALVPSS